MNPIDLTNRLFNKSGNDAGPTSPLYHGTRVILGLYDLVASFKTNKCPHSCTFCSLPSMSKETDVSREQLIQQVDWLFQRYSSELEKLEQLTVRNEGSVLSARQFHPESLDYLIAQLGAMPRLKKLSLETRLEYVTGRRLQGIMESMGSGIELDLTVGFETQDEYILNTILGKNLNKDTFEKKVALLGRNGVSLTAYVMLKPAPRMSEQEGVEEAMKSIDYLSCLSRRHGTKLTIYLNPTYAAKGSKLAAEMESAGYLPPSIDSLSYAVAEAEKKGIRIYTDPVQ